MYLLDNELWFPDVSLANSEGILAVGGDLSLERLILAYHNGIFPWYDEQGPILWWAPPMRMVVIPKTYKPPKSLKAFIKRSTFEITFNQCFEDVIRHCQKSPRKDGDGTWINEDIVNSFTKLHQIGLAKSVEVWQNGELVGGLYGLDLGHVFCGESMFSLVSNSSKTAFVWLVDYLKARDYKLLDCQIYNDHLALLGAFEIEREEFMKILEQDSQDCSHKQT